RLDGQKIWAALCESILGNSGDVGWGKRSEILFVRTSATNICIIRVARDHHKIAWRALTSITGIPNVIHLSVVAGTIKNAQLAAISHHRVRIQVKIRKIRGAVDLCEIDMKYLPP
ncbi:hypothetical protein B0H13DRAFT_1618581, partial [Mycena leptocephala]